MASMMTTGKPSAKLGSTRARAARISVRTCSLLIQPVIRTWDCKPCRVISSSICGRISPSPARTISNATPCSAKRRAASSNNNWPFCSHRRPTQTNRGADGTATAGTS
ncbi:hypothetical protein D3C81_1618850 [compost metagenome]